MSSTNAVRMSPTKEVYTFQWTEALMLASGSYCIQFKVKQGARVLDNMKSEPSELFTKSENGRGAIMKPWQQGLEREDPVAFVDNEISIVLQTDATLEPVFIHITLSKLDQDQPSTSNDKEKFKIVSLTKIQLRRPIKLFRDEVDSLGKHDRTQRLIKFYKSFEKEKFRYMIGWIKYTQEITTIEETESPLPQLPEVEEPTVRQGSSDVLGNVQIATDTVLSASRPSRKGKTESDNTEAIKTPIPIEVLDTQTGLNPDEVFKRSTWTRRPTPYLTQKDGSSDELGNVQIATDTVLSASRPSRKGKTESDTTEAIKTPIPIEVLGTQTGLNPDEVFKRSTLTRRSTPYLTQKDAALSSEPQSEEIPMEEPIRVTEETKSATSKENAVLSPHAVISSPVPLKQPSFNEQTNQKEENEDKLGKELRVDHDKDNVEDDAAKEMYIKRKTMESALNLDLDLPDVNAIKVLLPKYHKLLDRPQSSRPAGASSVAAYIPINEPKSDERNASSNTEEINLDDQILLPKVENEIIDSGVAATIEFQAEEIKRYRMVIQTMGGDVVKLRKMIAKLEHEKVQLMNEAYNDQDEDTVIGLLKRRIAVENREKSKLKERVQLIQNQLIQKNEMEASYVELQLAHEKQQKMLQMAQGKLNKYKILQDACQKQEKVIEELEKRLKESKVKHTEKVKKISKETTVKEMKNVAFDENTIISHKKDEELKANINEVTDKIHLIQKLEHAEATVAALELQLYQNTKEWAKEKSRYDYERSVGNQLAVYRNKINSPVRMTRSHSIDHPTYYPNMRRYQPPPDFQPPQALPPPQDFNWNDLPRYSYHRRDYNHYM